MIVAKKLEYAVQMVESIARQPEMAGRIFINMLLTAAFVEGVALFAVVAGFLNFGK